MLQRNNCGKLGTGEIADTRQQETNEVRHRCKSWQGIMKEDKENTRPRERKVEIKCDENDKPEKPNKEKKEAMTKVTLVS